MGLKIGEVTLKHGLLLAPMAGVSDRVFRHICMSHGAEYSVSEMVSAKALCYEQRGRSKTVSVTAELASVFAEDMPMAVQIFGSEPIFMAEGAKMIATGEYKGCLSTVLPAAIDINMGCPVRKITSNGEGSVLMKNPKLVGEIAEAVCKSVSIPVTVKIRAGWDAENINAPEIAKILESAGVSAICVHARTREQLYTPGIDMSVIERVKNAVKIPIIGNGDICSAKDALDMLDKTGCDGIMIGRAAMGNPWIFEEIKSALEGNGFDLPHCAQRLQMAKEHLLAMLKEYGEKNGTAQAKKHICKYITEIHGSATARNRVMTASTSEEINIIIEELAKNI